MTPSPGRGHTAALPLTGRAVQLPGLLATSAPESWVGGSRGSQGNCIWVPTTWDGGPAAAAWNTGVPPELAAHAEVDPKVSATLCSSERSSLPASWSRILVLRDSSVYYHLLTPTPCRYSATRSQQSHQQLAQVPPVSCSLLPSV